MAAEQGNAGRYCGWLKLRTPPKLDGRRSRDNELSRQGCLRIG